MHLPLSKAVFDRWVAAGFQTSIAKLYPGKESSSPEGTRVTRADYFIGKQHISKETNDSIVRSWPITIRLWGPVYETVSSQVDLIKAKYSDSHRALGSPFAVDSSLGEVLEVTVEDSEVLHVEDNLSEGTVLLEALVQEIRVVPT